MRSELWLQFKNREDFINKENLIYEALEDNYGGSSIVIYLRDTRNIKRLPATKNIYIDDDVIVALEDICGKDSVKVVEKHDPYYELKKACVEAPDYLDPERLRCVEMDSINRIADALEEIGDNLERLANCVGYIPPTPLQKVGYYIFRIGGCIDNGN